MTITVVTAEKLDLQINYYAVIPTMWSDGIMMNLFKEN